VKILYYFLISGLILNTAQAQTVSVLTHRYENTRSGWNSRETLLTPQTVGQGNFGLQYTLEVDDQVYAQPLLAPNVTIGGTTVRTVLIAATVNNSVYAFNADKSGPPLWRVNLDPTGMRAPRNTDMTGACNGAYKDFSGNMGIVGTPVIDTLTGTIYVVSRSVTINNKYGQYLHALDLRTGAERPGSPVVIEATYPGTGDGSVRGMITFDPQKQNQRSALLLHDGVVYVCWASHCDWGPYHGWIMGFDAATLTKKYVYNTTPAGYNGGIWMSGAGPTVDAEGNMYVTIGNGSFRPTAGGDRSEGVLKLKPINGTLTELDYFVPANYNALEKDDLDYGVDGLLLIPNTTLSLSGSKEGKLYLLDTKNLGQFDAGNKSVLQEIYVNDQTIYDKHIHGTPVYYSVVDQGVTTEYVYVWSESDYLAQIQFNRTTNRFETGKMLKGNTKLDYGMPGSSLTVSSNGSTAGSGIVWASHPLSGDANQQLRPGSVEAFDARDIRKRLWTSAQLERDAVGYFAKFNTPVVANGRVYVATFSNKINVYGVYAPGTVTALNPAFDAPFVVYPNPGQGEFSVQYSLPIARPGVLLQVIDARGRVLLTLPMDPSAGNHTRLVPMAPTWPAGVYEVILSAEDQVLHRGRLVRE
jgi:hypothetical protein